jgi:hypothetical protein
VYVRSSLRKKNSSKLSKIESESSIAENIYCSSALEMRIDERPSAEESMN